MKPILAVVDIQKEYATKGRPYFIRGIGPSLRRAEAVLAAARRRGWTIVHVRHLQKGGLFGRGSPFSDFVDGFAPRTGELSVVKGDYSCYSSPAFARFMKKSLARPVYVIGYGSTKCCLATIVDGYHRGQKLFFVADASNAKRSERYGEKALHAYATDILRSYCTVVGSKSL